MKTLVIGGWGLLGRSLVGFLPEIIYAPTRSEFPLESKVGPSEQVYLAFLCAGTKGTEACEGNRKAFRSDVDGNIRLARHLLKQGTFVVFVSSDAVEWSNSAYARNRWAVELAIGGLPNVAIFRPGRFDASNVAEVARACAEVGLQRREGLTRWP